MVALKPTVGRVSRTGVMLIAKSQDSPGPIAQTVYDAATAAAGDRRSDSEDPATDGRARRSDYVGGLDADALDGKTVAVTSRTTTPNIKAPYEEALTTF